MVGFNSKTIRNLTENKSRAMPGQQYGVGELVRMFYITEGTVHRIMGDIKPKNGIYDSDDVLKKLNEIVPD